MANVAHPRQPDRSSAIDEPTTVLLIAAARAIDRGDTGTARRLLASLAERTGTDRVAQLAAHALRQRAGATTTAGGNPYADDRAGPDSMLAAFDVLYRHTPLIQFGHGAANQRLAAAIHGARQVHLVDLGVGCGVQWDPLLAELAATGDVRRVRLTGVDLPTSDGRAADTAHATGRRLAATAARCGIAFEYTPLLIPIERLEPTLLAPRRDEVLAVNAAFALHHLSTVSGTGSARNRCLRMLAGLRPRVLTLVEPDTQHDVACLAARVAHVLRHYRAVFAALAALLPAHPRARDLIERRFFGTEINNILACDGPDRVERHESRQAWCARLASTGYRCLPAACPVTPDAGPLGDGGRVVRDADLHVLSWHDTPLLFAGAWRPN